MDDSEDEDQGSNGNGSDPAVEPEEVVLIASTHSTPGDHPSHVRGTSMGQAPITPNLSDPPLGWRNILELRPCPTEDWAYSTPSERPNLHESAGLTFRQAYRTAACGQSVTCAPRLSDLWSANNLPPLGWKFCLEHQEWIWHPRM
jgi:hypothetical protein